MIVYERQQNGDRSPVHGCRLLAELKATDLRVTGHLCLYQHGMREEAVLKVSALVVRVVRAARLRTCRSK